MALPSTTGFFIQTAQQIRTSKKSSSSFLIPNSHENSNYVLAMSEATDICQKLLRKYRFGEEMIVTCKAELVSASNKDLYARIAQGRGLKDRENLKGEKTISFDAFQEQTFITRFMMKKWVQAYQDKFVRLRTDIGMSGSFQVDSKRTIDELTYVVGWSKIAQFF